MVHLTGPVNIVTAELICNLSGPPALYPLVSAIYFTEMAGANEERFQDMNAPTGAAPSPDTLATLFEILKSFNKAGVNLTPGTRFSEDLNFDSLVVMEFVAEVEDAFDISVPLNILPGVATIENLALAVEKIVEE